MYKLLLCWRYLKTRYLAFLCIGSVMLGVATLIVVNSVMSGFSNKLKDRLHDFLSDVVIEAPGLEGFADPEEKMARIKNHPILGDRIEVMCPIMEVFALVFYRYPNGDPTTRLVRVIGVDPEARAKVAGFKEFLTNPAKDPKSIFNVSDEAKKRQQWFREVQQHRVNNEMKQGLDANDPPPPIPPPAPAAEDVPGVILGHLIAHYRKEGENGKPSEDIPLLNIGDDVRVLTFNGMFGSDKFRPVERTFTVVDYFRTGLSEADNGTIFVDLKYLQTLRTMENRASAILVKLRDYEGDKAKLVPILDQMFGRESLMVSTWERKQGSLLSAIETEKLLLNILLFLIVGVAGFGILSIFSMIVTEKTRDIGILKALGASSPGVLNIFLGYALLLGTVGSGLGTILGVLFTRHINEIAWFIAWVSGKPVFDPKIYYFDKIPTQIEPGMLLQTNLAAIAVAIVFSILPALKAARLKPVQALRYE